MSIDRVLTAFVQTYKLMTPEQLEEVRAKLAAIIEELRRA